ncbi:ABC transporter permease [Alicyclobacillus cellulosilyticus]|uniref:ABC transporter permease n=1 Tax=Alicyclobacillus cellulosilyticus TaxID=1003997 RepID=A0A917K445_9BACL|nr:sugar ABC transporter permease [Alicyclobacillus cellulosilyticus]GGJ00336.1 ABC transporter permease [Alicyclobacillus cellulosilyticus]
MSLHWSYRTQKAVLIISFLLIPLALLVTFSIYPFFKLIYYSFTSWDGLSPTFTWVGFNNYVQIFKNPALFGAFAHNFSYFVGGIVQNIFALILALVLNSRIRARNLFRTILFVPYILNSVAVVYIFKFMYLDNGALDILLNHLGLSHLETSWLGNDAVVNWSLAFVSFWQYFPFNMVIYLAALQSLPQDMYEAASLDGASRWQTLWFITLPNLKSIIQINLLLTVSGALEAFNIPFVMTNASPPTATFLTNTMNVAFTFHNFGLASAMAIVLLIIVFIVISIQQWLLGGRREAA